MSTDTTSTTQRPINTGGSAFPTAPFVYPDGDEVYGEPGMTLRDWFAGQALAGLLARPGNSVGRVMLAYACADEMLAERDKRTQQ